MEVWEVNEKRRMGSGVKNGETRKIGRGIEGKGSKVREGEGTVAGLSM